MCYSAQVVADYNRYVRVVGLDEAMNIRDFVRSCESAKSRQVV